MVGQGPELVIYRGCYCRTGSITYDMGIIPVLHCPVFVI